MAADMEKIEMKLLEHDERLEKSVNVFKSDLLMIRVGRANPHVLDKVMVDYYGEMTPINQVGNMSVVDGQCLIVAPWDKSLLKAVEKAIQVANIGINPTNDGNVIRLVFPLLTEERRKELVKQVKKMGEDGKVAIRNIRRDVLDGFKKLKTSKEITEDQYAEYESAIEKMTSKTVEAVDKVIADKEKDLLTV